MISCHLACVTDDIKSPPVIWISLQSGFVQVQQNLHLCERFPICYVKDQNSSDRPHELKLPESAPRDIAKDELVILLAVLVFEDSINQHQGYLKLGLFHNFFVILSTEMFLNPLGNMKLIISEIVDLHP